MAFLNHRGGRPWQAAALTTLLAAAACAPGTEEGSAGQVPEPESLLVYSGRNEALIAPLLERFTAERGVAVAARYGGTAEMAATLMEEGERSPADVFISQDAAALAALAQRGLLAALPEPLLARVAPHFRAPGGEWVGLSGRARTVVYEPARIGAEELPRGLADLGSPRYRGRFGIAPTNASLQAHLAAYRAREGAAALERLLAAIAANEPRIYPKNSAIVEAVVAGEIDFGLVNHYYLWRAKAENETITARNAFMSRDNFVNVAGAAVLRERATAVALIDFLLSEPAQRYFAGETFEYPLVGGIESAVELEPLVSLAPAETDFERLSADLEPSLAAINASGLVR